jgi:hypothetical protein
VIRAVIKEVILTGTRLDRIEVMPPSLSPPCDHSSRSPISLRAPRSVPQHLSLRWRWPGYCRALRQSPASPESDNIAIAKYSLLHLNGKFKGISFELTRRVKNMYDLAKNKETNSNAIEECPINASAIAYPEAGGNWSA